MGAATTCSLARRAAAAGAPAAVAGTAAAGAAGAAGITGAAIIAGCTWVTTPPVGMRLMRTASSPSLISISAIPDSSSSSISFLTLRMSNLFVLGDACGRSLNRQLVSNSPEPDDAAHGDVREIRVVAEFLPRESVGEVQFDE